MLLLIREPVFDVVGEFTLVAVLRLSLHAFFPSLYILLEKLAWFMLARHLLLLHLVRVADGTALVQGRRFVDPHPSSGFVVISVPSHLAGAEAALALIRGHGGSSGDRRLDRPYPTTGWKVRAPRHAEPPRPPASRRGALCSADVCTISLGLSYNYW